MYEGAERKESCVPCIAKHHAIEATSACCESSAGGFRRTAHVARRNGRGLIHLKRRAYIYSMRSVLVPG